MTLKKDGRMTQQCLNLSSRCTNNNLNLDCFWWQNKLVLAIWGKTLINDFYENMLLNFYESLLCHHISRRKIICPLDEGNMTQNHIQDYKYSGWRIALSSTLTHYMVFSGWKQQSCTTQFLAGENQQTCNIYGWQFFTVQLQTCRSSAFRSALVSGVDFVLLQEFVNREQPDKQQCNRWSPVRCWSSRQNFFLCRQQHLLGLLFFWCYRCSLYRTTIVLSSSGFRFAIYLFLLLLLFC